jgi:hypothetical protein
VGGLSTARGRELYSLIINPKRKGISTVSLEVSLIDRRSHGTLITRCCTQKLCITSGERQWVKPTGEAEYHGSDLSVRLLGWLSVVT